jgi:hypothetical protein
MGLFDKQSSDLMQKRAVQDAKDAYRRHCGEIDAFLRGLSAQDKAYFEKCVEKLLELTLPYEGQVSYPNSVAQQVKDIGNDLYLRFGGKQAQRIALYLYAPKAPVFSGQVERHWFFG